MQTSDKLNNGIAIIGMAGRFPEARNIDAFWDLLVSGHEAFQLLSDAELLTAGVPADLLHNPNYVKNTRIVPEVEYFDADFFDMSKRDAEITDPQQRIFLECAYQALESAGYPPTTTNLRTGVYAGTGDNSYREHYLQPRMQELLSTVGSYRLHILNDKDYLATRTAYKLNLHGPAISVQTACSTSLTAVHTACQSLLNFECDLALAGGVTLDLPQSAGYLYQEGMILSPDGHCRAFDADANGTVVGGGAGIVVLKRLEEAQEDRDTIYAVIRGSAINNDGSRKIGFTAPSVSGQADVILDAQAVAEVEADDISYIEAHGTGTSLGDPIEIQALTQAFRTTSSRKGYCAIGSVKTNIGHADTASGVAGLIKTALALHHKELPASLHYHRPNPQINFADSPFFVNTKRSVWETANGQPRCAGVSSFGIGGTNAHVIVQEAPKTVIEDAPSREAQLLLLSAKKAKELESIARNLHQHLQQHPEQNLADVAFTLNCGRETFSKQRWLVCQDRQDAITQLAEPASMDGQRTTDNEPRVAFLLPGQGSQYAGMAQRLYADEVIFRNIIDQCADILLAQTGVDIRQVIFAADGRYNINQTSLTQPALFTVEYALATLWMHWGIQPTALLGHSIGEYVAACLAGVFSLEDALVLSAMRGQLIQSLPAGAMLAVPLSEAEAQSWCSASISLAVINGRQRCVLAGTPEAVNQLQSILREQGIEGTLLHTSHAFHSHMLEPVLDTFAARLHQLTLQPPKIPYLSNLSGNWISATEATDPEYWIQHLRHTVRFSDNLAKLFAHDMDVLLEVGPGRILSALARQHPACPTQCTVLQSLPAKRKTGIQQETRQLLQSLGQLRAQGAPVNWKHFYADEQRRRLPLPTYPFARQRHWLDRPVTVQPAAASPFVVPFSVPAWQNLTDNLSHSANAELTKILETERKTHEQVGLDQLCAQLMSLTLQHMGAFAQSETQPETQSDTQPDKWLDANTWLGEDTIREQCGVIPFYQQLLKEWLNVLLQHHFLQEKEGRFARRSSVITESELVALATRVSRAETVVTYLQADKILLLSQSLANALRGQQNPRELLVNFWEEESPDTPIWEKYHSQLLREGLQALIAQLPASAGIRMLEIGGGMGIATSAILPVLPPERISYLFTDQGRYFLRRAEKKFSAYPFMQYRQLDIEQSFTEQGIPKHTLDIVIAVNVLHVGSDMDNILAQVRDLLAPGGLLILWEITRAKPDFCVFDGLLMQPITDTDRNQGNPFLSKQEWEDKLQGSGFEQVASFPDTHAFRQNIIIARTPIDKSDNSEATPAFTVVPQPTTPVGSTTSVDPAQEQTSTTTEKQLPPITPTNKNNQNNTNNIKAAITAIWKECIGSHHIDPHDDFFALGGDSLIAVQVTSLLNKAFQAELTVNTLLSNPSVAALAQLLSQKTLQIATTEHVSSGEPTPTYPLVQLQRGAAAKQPLFLAHPAGGNLFLYRHLVSSLPDDLPIYGFEAPGLQDNDKVEQSVEEMAADYVSVMTSFKPKGPYYLAGASSGGLVIFEMAHQLRNSGHEVAFLGLFDTPVGKHMPVKLNQRSGIINYFADTFSENNDLIELIEHMPIKLDTEQKIDWLFEETRRLRRLPESMDIGQWKRLINVFAANVDAVFNYTPKRYPGHLTFFRAQERRLQYDPKYPEQPWLDLAEAGVEVHVVPGDHLSMFYPLHIERLVAKLTPYLDQHLDQHLDQ